MKINYIEFDTVFSKGVLNFVIKISGECLIKIEDKKYKKFDFII